MEDVVAGHLEVGMNDRGEVVLNVPPGETDAKGWHHFNFSPRQAMALGELMIRKGFEAERSRSQGQHTCRPGICRGDAEDRGSVLTMGKRSSDTWCRHRTPFGDDYPVCKVGVDFHQFLKDGQGFTKCPCIGETAEARALCSQYSGLSAEELADRDAEHEARMKRVGIIRRAIMATGEYRGTIDCPACKTGKVGFSVARCNGHVHARCSTEGCASWIE